MTPCSPDTAHCQMVLKVLKFAHNQNHLAMKSIVRTPIPLFVLLVAGLFLSTLGCEEQKARKAAIREGEVYFKSYCAICHGENADGKGDMASMLDTPPMDLTTIAKRRGGVFPDDEIARIIATAERTPGHSLGEMPAWWETLKRAEKIDDPEIIRQKIENIVAYLKTLQKE